MDKSALPVAFIKLASVTEETLQNKKNDCDIHKKRNYLNEQPET